MIDEGHRGGGYWSSNPGLSTTLGGNTSWLGNRRQLKVLLLGWGFLNIFQRAYSLPQQWKRFVLTQERVKQHQRHASHPKTLDVANAFILFLSCYSSYLFLLSSIRKCARISYIEEFGSPKLAIVSAHSIRLPASLEIKTSQVGKVHPSTSERTTHTEISENII